MNFKKLNINCRAIKKTKNYLYLILLISFLATFVLYVAPCIDDLQYVQPLTTFIDEREINAGALYYTEIEEFSIAEINMINTFDYVPRFNPEKEK